MKRIALYIFVLMLLMACEKVLDKRELNAIDGQDIWNDESLANLFLNDIYASALPSFAGSSNTNISDESVGSGEGAMMYGLLTKEAAFGNFNSDKWYIIRQLNLVFDGIENGTMDEENQNLILGQAYFLRAWTYWQLVIYYGGVPLILEVQDPTRPDSYRVTRNSAHECIAQIADDLDNAIELLPVSWPNERGRVTRAAAASLKGRVLLYYASPQFNPDNLEARWQDAYDANQEAYTICEQDGYALYPDYANIFIDEGATQEAIFITVFDNVSRYHSYEDNVRPRSVSNERDAVQSPPNWEFVKSYPMYDGLPAEGHPEYDSTYYWKNRDPRFYATIAYNGMRWDLAGIENRRQWTYLGNVSEPATLALGASPTGFYLKKNINPDLLPTETPYTPTDWIEIRLAEVYLNLAECAAETNRLDEALDLLIAIRERAGIEAGDGSYGITASNREAMLEAVMLERKIELAFENKRHWDLRRRNLFINGINNTPPINGMRRHGLLIDLNTSYIMSLDAGVDADSVYSHFQNIMMDTIDLDISYGTYFSTNYANDMDPVEINYLQPEYNFLYIPTDELEKNPNMQQTIYWTDVDPFDPLAD